jgi:heme/copper-type cytochrome/quinol oxidase subunit 2
MRVFNYFLMLYISIGVILYAISLWKKFRAKQKEKYTVGEEIILSTAGIIVIILLWPILIIFQYKEYRKFKKLLKGKIKPFYRFFLYNETN